MSHSIYNCQWQFAHAYELAHEFVVACCLHVARNDSKTRKKKSNQTNPLRMCVWIIDGEMNIKLLYSIFIHFYVNYILSQCPLHSIAVY